MMKTAKDLRRGSVIVEDRGQRSVVGDIEPCRSRHKVHVRIKDTNTVWCYDRDQEVWVLG